MNTRTEDDLDRIFASFHEDRHSRFPRPLASWISEHPDLKNCFVRWATEMPAMEIAEMRPTYQEFEARTLAIGQSILQRVGLAQPVEGELISLNEAARACGLWRWWKWERSQPPRSRAAVLTASADCAAGSTAAGS